MARARALTGSGSAQVNLEPQAGDKVLRGPGASDDAHELMLALFLYDVKQRASAEQVRRWLVSRGNARAQLRLLMSHARTVPRQLARHGWHREEAGHTSSTNPSVLRAGSVVSVLCLVSATPHSRG